MNTHSFTLVLDGVDLADDAVLDTLFEAGFGDSTFGISAGVPYVAMERNELLPSATVLEAIHTIEDAVPGLRVVRVQPDELVTTSDIAGRVGRTRESVRLLAEGRRGPRDFPPPALLLHGSQPIWHWSEVARWFRQYAGLPDEEVARAEFFAAINGALEVRRHTPQLHAPDQRDAVAQLVAGFS